MEISSSGTEFGLSDTDSSVQVALDNSPLDRQDSPDLTEGGAVGLELTTLLSKMRGEELAGVPQMLRSRKMKRKGKYEGNLE